MTRQNPPIHFFPSISIRGSGREDSRRQGDQRASKVVGENDTRSARVGQEIELPTTGEIVAGTGPRRTADGLKACRRGTKRRGYMTACWTCLDLPRRTRLVRAQHWPLTIGDWPLQKLSGNEERRQQYAQI